MKIFLILFAVGILVIASPTYSETVGDGIVTLTFDDANQSQYEYPVQILSANNQKATMYVQTGFVGDEGYVTWSQLQGLPNMGIELAGHSVTHAELPEIHYWQMVNEVRQCRLHFTTIGVNPTGFATPFGAYDNQVLATIAKEFNSQRGYHEIGFNAWPYNKYYLHIQRITNTTSVEEVEGWIDEATQNGWWLIIVFHEVLPEVDPSDDTSWTVSNFNEMMAHLNNRGIKTKTVGEVLKATDNLLSGGSFEDIHMLGGTWKTDTASQVRVDGASHGSYPAPTKSIKMQGGFSNAHLFGPQTAVDSNLTYGVRFFVNSAALYSGELGFYIDEYDQNGNWVSGQWLGMSTLNFVIDESFAYKPSSSNVSHAAIQVYLTGGSSGHAFIDNVEMFLK